MMHWWLTNLNISIVTLVFVSCVVTSHFALKNLRTYSLVRRTSVLVLNVCASLVLLALILGFSYNSVQAVHWVLLTPHSQKQVIEALQDEYKTINWIVLNGQNIGLTNEGVDLLGGFVFRIEHIAQLPLYFGQINELSVVGDGLTQDEWSIFNAHYKHTNTQAQPILQTTAYSPLLGLIDMQWPSQLVSAQYGQISGRLQVPSDSESTLYELMLTDPFEQVLASVLLANNEHFTFNISSNIPGRWQYTLTLIERGNVDNKIEEQLGVDIVDATPVKVMIKQSAPSFESKQLLSVIGESSGKALTLTQISKNKDIRQQLNLSDADKSSVENALSEQTLRFFDLVIIDQQALSELNIEQSALLEAAIKNGLGVLVQVQAHLLNDWPSARAPWLDDIELMATNTLNQPAQYLSWDQTRLEIPLSTINATIHAPKAKQLVSDQNNRAVVVSQAYGQGTIAVSLVNTSYTLKTQGRSDLHSHYWQWIFSQISRAKGGLQWQQRDPVSSPIIVEQAHTACLLNASEATQIRFEQGGTAIPIYPFEQVLDPDSMCINYTPHSSGWYRLRAMDEVQGLSTQSYFAYHQSAWQAWQQSIRYTATQQNTLHYQSSERPPPIRSLLVNPIWFWVLLMGILTALWIERKTRI